MYTRDENAAQRYYLQRFLASICVNSPLSTQWKVLGFEWPYSLETPKPGQFFTCRPRTGNGQDACLLRRPLAFAGMSGSIALALYQVRGPGTKTLATMKIGEPLDIIAPLGNAFPLPALHETATLLGGGVGIGPMLFHHSQLSSSSLFLGFRSESSIPVFDSNPLLAGLSTSLASAKLATDDGTRGYRGTVLESAHIFHALSKNGEFVPHLYACGPSPMLAAIDRFCVKNRFAAHLSTEQWMACGVGACYGCVLPAMAGGYLRACADGPVFEAGIIDWDGGLHA